MNFYDAAKQVAREFLETKYGTLREIHVTIGTNVILDMWFSSEEPDFTRRVCEHQIYGRTAKGVVSRMAPHIEELAGRAYREAIA